MIASMPRGIRLLVLLALVGLGISGFELWQLREGAIEREPTGVLRVGVLPDQDQDALAKRYGALLAHLEASTDLKFDLVTGKNYTDILDRFVSGEIDMAWLGGATFVQARERAGAEPLVTRDTDARFTSAYIVRTEGAGASVTDYEGKRIAFNDELSTSGYIMPLFFLEEDDKIVPEAFFASVEFSGTHDNTIEWVKSGRVDIGVANAQIVQAKFDSGELSAQHVTVLAETPPYADYVWTVQRTMPRHVIMRLTNAFLELSMGNPEHAAILRANRCTTYLPAKAEDWSYVERAARAQGLLGGAP
ncbi:MAG: phosphate/phosphite/phosphonate ABC transporter substrate-binding protein [Planctomycetota bacterium]|nr:phosphate/phosphite/phosphonate ABC transporter substrate-binding protein [Planctomycetota bacterium]